MQYKIITNNSSAKRDLIVTFHKNNDIGLVFRKFTNYDE